MVTFNLSQFAETLNSSKEYLKCYYNENFFKVAILENSYKSIFYKYIAKKFRKTNPKFDFNVIDVVGGKPETILDYIDAILRGEKGALRTPRYIKDVKKLRRFLSHETKGFGAKKFVDLPPALQKEALARAKKAKDR
jgi:hypothetical protein